MATMPRELRLSSAINTPSRCTAIRLVTMAGQTISVNEEANPEIEFARPRILSSARLLISGFLVGATKVSPNPNRPTKANKNTIRQPGPSTTSANPRTAQDTAKIKPMTAREELRRCRWTSRNTSIWVATMTAVLMVKDSAIAWSEMWAATEAKAAAPESKGPGR